MSKFLFSWGSRSTYETKVSLALLFLRLVCGVGMILHGWGKIQNPMSWMGPESGVPGFLQLLAALSEFGGGLAWILGLLMPLASAGIAVTMAVAASVHLSKGDGFIQGYELALIYLAVALLLGLAGPGRFAVDARVGGK